MSFIIIGLRLFKNQELVKKKKFFAKWFCRDQENYCFGILSSEFLCAVYIFHLHMIFYINFKWFLFYILYIYTWIIIIWILSSHQTTCPFFFFYTSCKFWKKYKENGKVLGNGETNGIDGQLLFLKPVYLWLTSQQL